MSKCIVRWRSVIHTISGHCDLDLWPSCKNFCVPSTSLIFFEVGIPNLVCICILAWWCLTYYFCDLDLWPSFNNCVRSISLIIWDRNLKFGVWIHLGMVVCLVPFTGHCDLDLWPSFNNNCVRSISLLLFEIGIPNFACECILGWWSVLYHLQVTVTLTFCLVFFKNHVQSISLILLR